MLFRSFILDEMAYDQEEMHVEHDGLYPRLTDEQRIIYDKIISVVNRGKSEVFFLYRYGGIGKLSYGGHYAPV